MTLKDAIRRIGLEEEYRDSESLRVLKLYADAIKAVSAGAAVDEIGLAVAGLDDFKREITGLQEELLAA